MSLAQVHAQDAKPRSHDPGRTSKLRKGFRAAADMQLNQLRAGLRQALVDFNVLGLSGGGSNYSMMSSGARLNQFAGWLENAANAALDARWWVHPWLDKATQHGLNSAKNELQGVEYQPIPTTFADLHELARHELRGIIGALVQKVVRQAHSAATRRLAPHQAFRELTKPLDGDIRNRLQLFAQHFGQKGHIHGKVEAYRQAGVRRIGVVPEMRRIRRNHDQRSSSGIRHSYTLHDVEPADATWVTADDDLVCDECEEMAAGSPYSLDEVMDLIPLHPNCRCTLTTYDGPEEEDFGDAMTVDFDPDELRDPQGQWSTGGGLSSSAISARRSAFEAKHGAKVVAEVSRLAADWYTMKPTSHMDAFLKGTLPDGPEKTAWQAVHEDTQKRLGKVDVIDVYRGIPGQDIVDAVLAAKNSGAAFVEIPIHDSHQVTHEAVCATGQRELAAAYAAKRWTRHGGDPASAHTGVVLHMKVKKADVVFSTSHSTFINPYTPNWNEYLVRTGGTPSIKLSISDIEVVQQ